MQSGAGQTETYCDALSPSHIHVLVVPMGNITQIKFNKYLALIKSYDHIDAGEFGLSDVENVLQIRYLSYYPYEEDAAKLHYSKNIQGLIGINDCSVDLNLSENYQSLEGYLAAHQSILAHRSLAFEPDEDTIDNNQNIVVIPNQGIAQLRFYLQTIVFDLLYSIANAMRALIADLDNQVAKLKQLGNRSIRDRYSGPYEMMKESWEFLNSSNNNNTSDPSSDLAAQFNTSLAPISELSSPVKPSSSTLRGVAPPTQQASSPLMTSPIDRNRRPVSGPLSPNLKSSNSHSPPAAAAVTASASISASVGDSIRPNLPNQSEIATRKHKADLKNIERFAYHRKKKVVGDLLLLSGKVSAALECYQDVYEHAGRIADLLWLASTLESMGCCIAILAERSIQLLPEQADDYDQANASQLALTSLGQDLDDSVTSTHTTNHHRHRQEQQQQIGNVEDSNNDDDNDDGNSRRLLSADHRADMAHNNNVSRDNPEDSNTKSFPVYLKDKKTIQTLYTYLEKALAVYTQVSSQTPKLVLAELHFKMAHLLFVMHDWLNGSIAVQSALSLVLDISNQHAILIYKYAADIYRRHGMHRKHSFVNQSLISLVQTKFGIKGAYAHACYNILLDSLSEFRIYTLRADHFSTLTISKGHWPLLQFQLLYNLASVAGILGLREAVNALTLNLLSHFGRRIHHKYQLTLLHTLMKRNQSVFSLDAKRFAYNLSIVMIEKVKLASLNEDDRNSSILGKLQTPKEDVFQEWSTENFVKIIERHLIEPKDTHYFLFHTSDNLFQPVSIRTGNRHTTQTTSGTSDGELTGKKGHTDTNQIFYYEPTRKMGVNASPTYLDGHHGRTSSKISCSACSQLDYQKCACVKEYCCVDDVSSLRVTVANPLSFDLMLLNIEVLSSDTSMIESYLCNLEVPADSSDYTLTLNFIAKKSGDVAIVGISYMVFGMRLCVLFSHSIQLCVLNQIPHVRLKCFVNEQQANSHAIQLAAHDNLMDPVQRKSTLRCECSFDGKPGMASWCLIKLAPISSSPILEAGLGREEDRDEQVQRAVVSEVAIENVLYQEGKCVFDLDLSSVARLLRKFEFVLTIYIGAGGLPGASADVETDGLQYRTLTSNFRILVKEHILIVSPKIYYDLCGEYCFTCDLYNSTNESLFVKAGKEIFEEGVSQKPVLLLGRDHHTFTHPTAGLKNELIISSSGLSMKSAQDFLRRICFLVTDARGTSVGAVSLNQKQVESVLDSLVTESICEVTPFQAAFGARITPKFQYCALMLHPIEIGVRLTLNLVRFAECQVDGLSLLVRNGQPSARGMLDPVHFLGPRRFSITSLQSISPDVYLARLPMVFLAVGTFCLDVRVKMKLGGQGGAHELGKQQHRCLLEKLVTVSVV